jgi:hypothetical protein
VTLSEEAKRQMAEADARRTAHLRGERPWYEDPGRFSARTIGVLAEVGPGFEIYSSEIEQGGRLNADLEPIGGIVVQVDAGGRTTDEWGELVNIPARFRTYDRSAADWDKAFRWLSEDEVNKEAIGMASDYHLRSAVRKFCREVGRGKGSIDIFEAHLVADAARLVAVLMGGR